MYPKIHNQPKLPDTYDRLDMLWERYPQYREMTTFATLDEILEEHASYRRDFDEALRAEYEAEHMEQFLVKLAWSDLPYRQATRHLIEAAGPLWPNPLVDSFLAQFEECDTDHKAYFLFPESCLSQFLIILEVCRRAERLTPIRNLFPDEDTVHYLAVFDKQQMDDVMLMFHLVYGNLSSDVPGGCSLYGFPLPWYLSHLRESGVVLRSPCLPDRLAKYQGALSCCHNPAKTVYVRRNIAHILESGFFTSELEFFRYLNQVIMPLFAWWYTDLAWYEEKDHLKTDWRLERTKIRTRLTDEGKIRPKWKHELSLFRVVRERFPDTLYQYRPEWMGRQSLDLFIPSRNTAIEYQGIQHYSSVDFFGGEEALVHRRELDEAKRRLCEEHGVRLVAWPYRLEPTKENVESILVRGNRFDSQRKLTASVTSFGASSALPPSLPQKSTGS